MVAQRECAREHAGSAPGMRAGSAWLSFLPPGSGHAADKRRRVLLSGALMFRQAMLVPISLMPAVVAQPPPHLGQPGQVALAVQGPVEEVQCRTEIDGDQALQGPGILVVVGRGADDHPSSEEQSSQARSQLSWGQSQKQDSAGAWPRSGPVSGVTALAI